jgi:hypothetical protein
MDNVIRPAFGARSAPSEPAHPKASPTPDEWRQLHLYGKAAGYLVGLLRDEDGPEGRTHRVVVGRLDTNAIEAVTVVPATPEGEIDAERAAMAVLRTLEILEADAAPRPA